MPEKYKDEDWLREQYVEKDKSTIEIAEKTDVTHACISRWLHKFGMEIGERDRYKYICPDCNIPYKNPSMHFTASDCVRPEISRVQKEMLRGLAMGDGSIDHHSKNWNMRWGSINKEFMEWFDWRMGDIGIEVRELDLSLEDKRKQFFQASDRKKSYVDNLNFHKVYFWSSISHPKINKIFSNWITNGEKKYPNELNLTPISLCIWYCGDGGLSWGGQYCNGVKIATVNESHKIDSILSSFHDIGLNPTVSSQERDGEFTEHTYTSIWFTGTEKKKFFDYIGEAPPGFEYKWETEDRERYNRLIKESKTEMEPKVKESIFDY